MERGPSGGIGGCGGSGDERRGGEGEVQRDDESRDDDGCGDPHGERSVRVFTGRRRWEGLNAGQSDGRPRFASGLVVFAV